MVWRSVQVERPRTVTSGGHSGRAEAEGVWLESVPEVPNGVEEEEVEVEEEEAGEPLVIAAQDAKSVQERQLDLLGLLFGRKRGEDRRFSILPYYNAFRELLSTGLLRRGRCSNAFLVIGCGGRRKRIRGLVVLWRWGSGAGEELVHG